MLGNQHQQWLHLESFLNSSRKFNRFPYPRPCLRGYLWPIARRFVPAEFCGLFKLARRGALLLIFLRVGVHTLAKVYFIRHCFLALIWAWIRAASFMNPVHASAIHKFYNWLSTRFPHPTTQWEVRYWSFFPTVGFTRVGSGSESALAVCFLVLLI